MSFSPDQLVSELEKRGAKLTRRTLSRYAQQLLVAPPVVRSLGRGRGGSSEFEAAALPEALAAYTLLSDRTGRVLGAFNAIVGPFVLGGLQEPFGNMGELGRVSELEVRVARKRAYTWNVHDLMRAHAGVKGLQPEERAARARWERVLVAWLAVRTYAKEGRWSGVEGEVDRVAGALAKYTIEFSEDGLLVESARIYSG